MRLARTAAGGDGRGDPRYGWVLVAVLGTTQIVSWGVLYYAFAVFLTPMQAELGLSTAQITGAFSLALGVSALAGLGLGRWLDRGGARLPITAGSVLAVVAVVAWSRVDSLAGLYLVFAGIGIAMAALLYEPAFIVITKWFSVRRRAALTALTLIGALASLIFSPLSERLIAAFGWRDALVVLALVLAAVTVPLHAIFLRPAPGGFDGADHEHRAGHGVERSPRRRPRAGFRLLTLSFVLATLATSSISVLLVALLIADGHAPGFAALAAGIAGGAQIPGRLLFAAAAPWLSGSRLPTVVFGLMSLSLGLLAIDRSSMTVVGFAILFGMSAGMTTLTRVALIGELYGRERYGHNSSLAAAFVTAARAAAPAGFAVVAGLAAEVLLWTLAAAAGLAALAAGRGVRQAVPLPAAGKPG